MSTLAQTADAKITHKDQLIAHFAQGEKPATRWRIGCEHEKFVFHTNNLKPVSYEEPNGIRDLLNGFNAYGWEAINEGDRVIALKRDKAVISLEPAGQFELSGAPLSTLHEVAAEIDTHLEEACGIGEKLGLGFLGLGFHPDAKREDLFWMPKGRYKIMRAYMPKVGTLGLDMMQRTCTVQVNLDYASEADMIKKFRVSASLQPIATALFAASPYTEGKANGFDSYRMHIWSDTDNQRSGFPEFVFENGFGYERYADYALDVPMYFVYRDGTYIDCSGQSFRDFIAGKLPALIGELPSLADWANHLTTLFPDVRLKQYLEMRGADTGSTPMLKALPAFWVGLLYDSTALDAAWNLVKEWTAAERSQLQQEAPRLGFKAKCGKQSAQEIAAQALAIAKAGLQRRAIRQAELVDESSYIDCLQELVASGTSYSAKLRAVFGEHPKSLAAFYHATELKPQKLNYRYGT